jgi:hypothetical protein
VNSLDKKLNIQNHFDLLENADALCASNPHFSAENTMGHWLGILSSKWEYTSQLPIDRKKGTT